MRMQNTIPTSHDSSVPPQIINIDSSLGVIATLLGMSFTYAALIEKNPDEAREFLREVAMGETLDGKLIRGDKDILSCRIGDSGHAPKIVWDTTTNVLYVLQKKIHFGYSGPIMQANQVDRMPALDTPEAKEQLWDALRKKHNCN